MNHEFTHGGSVGKNLGLLLRGWGNMIAFIALWFGLITYEKYSFSLWLIIGGGALSLLFLFVNLILPYLHRKK